MATITEINKFHPDIYELATTDRVKGGTPVFDEDGVTPTDGASNAQAKLLADRTSYLKSVLSSLFDIREGVDAILSSTDVIYAANTEFDDLRNTGFYKAGGTATDNPLASSAGDLIVMRRFLYAGGVEGSMLDIESITQIYITSSGIYIRESSGTGIPAPGWTSWVQYEPSNVTTPPGAVQAFAMNTAPTGWLACSGQAVSRTSYARLFAAIGTTFGVGDGSTTFNLPDLRGEFIRGWDNGRGVDTGRVFGSAQAQAIQNHLHVIPTADFLPAGGVGAKAVAGTDQGQVTLATGGDETRPRNIALLYCIRF